MSNKKEGIVFGILFILFLILCYASYSYHIQELDIKDNQINNMQKIINNDEIKYNDLVDNQNTILNNDIDGENNIIKRINNLNNNVNNIDNRMSGMNLSLNCDCSKTKMFVEGCDKYFEQIIKSFSKQKEYVVDEYDCTEYSKYLSRRLNELGWRSMTYITQVKNCTKFDCSVSDMHMVIKVSEVFVEGTTGEIIHPDEYKDYGIRN